LAGDCYKLLQFIEGASSLEVHDLFRPVSLAEYDDRANPHVQDCDPVPQEREHVCGNKDVIASLHATVHQLMERLSTVEYEVKSLRSDLKKAKDDHNEKRAVITERNQNKEKNILELIETARTEGKEHTKELTTFKSGVHKTENEIMTKLDSLTHVIEQNSNRIKGQNQECKELKRELTVVNNRIDNLAEPKDALLSSLKSQLKTLKTKLKDIDQETQTAFDRVTSNTNSISDLRNRLTVSSKSHRETRKDLKKLQNAIPVCTLTGYSDALKRSTADSCRSSTELNATNPSAKNPLTNRHHSAVLSETDNQDSHSSSSPDSSQDYGDCGQHIGSVPQSPHTSQQVVLSPSRIGQAGVSQASPNVNDHSTVLPLVDRPHVLTATATQTASSPSNSQAVVAASGRQTSSPDIHRTTPDSCVIPVVTGTRRSRPLHVSPGHRTQVHELMAETTVSQETNISVYVGNIKKTVTEESIRKYFARHNVPVIKLILLPSHRQGYGNGVKLTIDSAKQDALYDLELPPDVYVRKWHEREFPKGHFGESDER
jgi:predicted  nucleic acid-binding Zn-ribbon protein